MIKLIAETAWHHEGDFDFMKTLVERIAKKTKADFIKLHITLDFEEYMHKDHPAYKLLKGMLFTAEQWETLIHIILTNDKKPMLLYNDTKAVRFGQKYKPEIIEIHSVCLNDTNLLQQVNKNIAKETKVVIGIGGTGITEVENAISLLDTKNVVLMHGFQNYPTKYNDINFGKIRKLMRLYPTFSHGYADHTAWNEQNNALITMMGAALGMDYIEKHVTTQPGTERIDWQAAITIDDLQTISNMLDVLKLANGNAS
nr:N-acetylneuraminate synthase family protein [Salinivirgaceae bacterium]